MNAVKQLLMLSWIVLIPFQDTGLQLLPIGFLGTSPSFIPLSLLILVHLVEWLFSNRPLKVSRIALYIVGYVLIISLAYLLISGFESHGRNLLVKTINLSVLTFLCLYPVFFINYHKVPRLGCYVRIAFLIAVIGVLLNDLGALSFVREGGIFHAREILSQRPCGFSGESSYLGVIVVSLGLLAAHFSRIRIEKVVIVTLTILLAIYSTSKGTVISLLIVAAIMTFLRSGIKWWLRAVLLVAIIVVGSYAFTALESRFAGDIERATSTSSRTVLMVTSLLMVVHNPFGVGFAGFLPAIDKFSPLAVEYLERLVDVPLKFSEVMAYIGADIDRGISTKTFLFDNFAYFGLPFLILYLVFHYRLISRLLKTERFFLVASALFCMIAISTYVPAFGIYSVSLVYGVAFSEVFRQENTGS